MNSVNQYKRKHIRISAPRRYKNESNMAKQEMLQRLIHLWFFDQHATKCANSCGEMYIISDSGDR